MGIEILRGAIFGGMTGDSIGLPYEGVSFRRQKKLFKNIAKHNFFIGKGVISDDTEHLLLTAYALGKSGGNEEEFEKELAKGLKEWFLTLPFGIGMATLKSCIKLLIGISPKKSGVFSAGNGPAMRSPVIGICFGDNKEKMVTLNKISSRITHTDEKAEIGSLCIAMAAHISSINKSEIKPVEFLNELKDILNGYNAVEFIKLMEETVESVDKNEDTKEFIIKKGWKNGVSGYIYQTVPAVIHCWLRNQNDYKKGVIEIIECGGDTDTTAAILGAIIGAKTGKESIPADWRENIVSWPYTEKYIETLLKEFDRGVSGNKFNVKKPLFLLVTIRNLLLYPLVLGHGFRRLLPPF